MQSKTITLTLLSLILGACSQQTPLADNQSATTVRNSSSAVSSVSSKSSSLGTSSSNESFVTLHTIGQVTRHAKNFLGTHVRMQGYLLKKETGYLIMSDETSGPLTIGDLPVTGSGIDAIQKGNKYIIDGMFLNKDINAENHNPHYLQLLKTPEMVK